jgi:hypothetical protein
MPLLSVIFKKRLMSWCVTFRRLAKADNGWHKPSGSVADPAFLPMKQRVSFDRLLDHKPPSHITKH